MKNLMLALIAGLLVGGAAGYYTKGQFEMAKEATQLRADKKESARGVIASTAANHALEQKVDASDKAVTAVQKAVAKQLAKPVKRKDAHEESAQCVLPAGDAALPFTVGTVRLLNAAREGVAVDAAAVVDGESQAPADLAVAEFVDNDLEVVRLYHELAAKHDALVEAVEKKLKEQAE
ncbi:hypothetical protein C0Q88_07870 [Ralstonia pickettii]|uniref:Uncharacterized protein n=1 Tax=Ralstonia pickettii TaxID=329 RepID=A0A2N4TY19_RALPI|nr:hypothetical protein [Ralstonia pickettii]PLC44588.1 hypothetical protein C0Q88_07870 [Ralstonia pickettii]